MLLVDIRNLHRLPYRDFSGIRLVNSHDEAEQGGLAGSVRTDDTHNARRRKHEIQILIQQLVPVGLAHIVEFDDLVAEVRSVRDVYFQIRFLFLHVRCCHLLIGSDTGLLLGLTCLRGHPDPFQLPLESLASLALGLFLKGKPLGLLVEP